MNRMKKFASIMLALVMAFALMAPAFASGETASNATITINNATVDHTYEAYQIFKGTLSGTGTETDPFVLADIDWGEGVNAASALTEANKVDGLKDAKTAAEIAERLANGVNELTCTNNEEGHVHSTDNNCYTHKTVDAYAFAQAMAKALATPTAKGTAVKTGEGENATVTATINVGKYGYYLVKDEKDTVQGADDSITLFMLEVVGPSVATAKAGTPTPDKKIIECTSTDPNHTHSNECKKNVGDYNIGDTVTFELKATLPNNYENYKTYKLVFNDTMSTGLDFKEITSIKVGGTEVYAENSTDYSVDQNGQSLTVTFADLRSSYEDLKNGGVITVTYTATLNAQAVVGNPGNDNEMYLEYSNNPNDDHGGETGKTPPKEVLVFTYKLDNTKVDGQNQETKLSGAEFVLYKKVAEGDGETEKWAVLDSNGNVTGWADTGYSDVENTTKIPVDGDSEAVADYGGTVLTTGADGKFIINGLDAGTYYLKEIKAPVGYNTLKNDITVVINPTYDETYDGTADSNGEVIKELEVTYDEDKVSTDDKNGTASANIVNNKGAELPETGGIGTTIFYALGGVMAVGAVVLLVTKKRMNADK